MKISFTGIHNVNINSGYREAIISFPNLDGSYEKLPGVETTLHLNCSLSDDEKGQDLGNFYNAMHKSNLYCQNLNKPYEVDIKAKIYTINDENIDGHIINYTINDYPIELDNPSDRPSLPLYSFIAQLSSKIAKQKNLSTEELECINSINQCCSAKAMHFIDNIM